MSERFVWNEKDAASAGAEAEAEAIESVEPPAVASEAASEAAEAEEPQLPMRTPRLEVATVDPSAAASRAVAEDAPAAVVEESATPRRASDTGKRVAEEPAAPRVPLRILVLGATSGIAEATARIWAERGDKLFLVARSGEKVGAMAADLATRGAAFVGTAIADLDDTAIHPQLLAHAINSLAGLDVAYIAVGSLGDSTAAEQSFAVAERAIHTNFVVPVSLLTWLGHYCAQRHAGTLAVLSSVAGERGRKSNYVYGASKAGLTAYLSGLRNRIDREGVRVITIKPGPVRTTMTEGMKGSEKFAEVGAVAATIVKALDRGADVVYVPGIWRVIMAVVRAVPERIFKKLNL